MSSYIHNRCTGVTMGVTGVLNNRKADRQEDITLFHELLYSRLYSSNDRKEKFKNQKVQNKKTTLTSKMQILDKHFQFRYLYSPW